MVRSNDDVTLSYTDKMPEEEVLNQTRAAELIEAKSFGKWEIGRWRNRLVLGDNLPVLKNFLRDAEIGGQIRLVYIDPPFATGRSFDENDDMTRVEETAYHDTLTGSRYLEFLRRRLVLLRELLADDGSIYLHLDQKMAHYAKVIMDEVFGKRNFRSWITRRKCHPKGFTKKSWGNVQDFILFYTKGEDYVWNRPLEELTPEKVKSSEYRYVEGGTGRIYKKVPLHAPGVRHGKTGEKWREMSPPRGKHWQYPPEKLDEYDRQGRVYWSPTGNPRLKVYLDERKGVLAQDIWLDYLDPMNQFTFETHFPTGKNLAMLERIVGTSSNEGDLVIDCFAGSGTTLLASEKLRRRWVGIDDSPVAINTCVRRLQAVPERYKLPPPQFTLYESVRGLFGGEGKVDKVHRERLLPRQPRSGP